MAAVLDGIQAEMSASGIDIGSIEDLGEIEELPPAELPPAANRLRPSLPAEPRRRPTYCQRDEGIFEHGRDPQGALVKGCASVPALA